MYPLIVVEGGDAAGKRTQVDLLVSELSRLEVSVKKFSFPRYESPTGRIIGRALKGRFGDFRNLHPHPASALYTVDRAAAKEKLLAWLEKGVVVCDRYTPSNVAFQSAKLPVDERDQFIRELEEIEYEDIALPRPRLVLFLDVPISVSSRLAIARAELDQHEKDLAYQELVAQVYRDLASVRDDWVLVTCTDGESFLSREAIHDKVMEVVRPVLSL